MAQSIQQNFRLIQNCFTALNSLPYSFFGIAANLLMLTGPLFMLQIYDRVLPSGSEETLVALFLLITALYVMMAGLDFARGRISARIGSRFQNRRDGPLFEALLKTALIENRTNQGPGLRDIDTVQSFYASPVFMALIDLPWTPLFLGSGLIART